MIAADPKPVGFGVIGANSFVANAAVLPAIDAAANARLIATASRSSSVPARWRHTAVESYDDVLQHPAVDAVYVPLPNGLHRTWTERAAAAGKHVLCEKPLAPDAASAVTMADACEQAGVVLAEAWMTPFDRRWSETLRLARSGDVGRIDAQHHRFTFTIPQSAADNYRWDPKQGGGALLDVGIYCVGTAVELWDVGCEVESVDRCVSQHGVDARTSARLRWPDGRVADIECSFVDHEQQSARFRSDRGELRLDHAAFTSGHADDDVIARVGPTGTPSQLTITPGDPYRTMVEAFADAITGRRTWPRPVRRSIELLGLIDRIAATRTTNPSPTDE